MATKFMNGLDLTGTAIKNVLDGVDPQDVVTYKQLQAAIQGYSWKAPVRAASTANLTLSGTQTVDGVALAAGDRVLVKNQTTGSANGIYLVAAGAWTRANDFDTGDEALGAAAFVSEGTANGNSVWLQTADAPITLDTTALVFQQIGAGVSYTGGNGITISGGTISVNTAVVARKYSATIGDGTATTLTVTHNLGTQDVSVTIRDASSNAVVLADVVPNTTNTVQITFATAPASGAFRVTVLG